MYKRQKEVGAEGDGRVGGVGEALGEDHVGREDRHERDHHRDQGPQRQGQAEQPGVGHQGGDHQAAEQDGVHDRQRRRAEAPGHLHRGQHRHEHPGEHDGVDHPRRAEQQREPGDVLGLQQQERDAEEEQVGVGAHAAERPGDRADRDHADQQDQP